MTVLHCRYQKRQLNQKVNKSQVPAIDIKCHSDVVRTEASRKTKHVN